MLDASSSTTAVVPTSSFHQHLNEASRLFQQNSYQITPSTSVVSPFAQHLGTHHHPGTLQSTQGGGAQQGHHQHNTAASAAAAVAAMSQSSHGGCMLAQLPHGLSSASQSLAAALFATSPLISDDLKLAAAAAAAAAAAQSRGKKTHRAEPVPQSGFKGVSWNSRMKAWLAFYVTENGERKSKTFSTRKLGMEEARLQAIAFCKQKQDQRREARKRNRGLQGQHCGGVVVNGTGGNAGGTLDKLSSDESIIGSPNAIQDQQQPAALRCGYPTTPGMSIPTPSMLGPGNNNGGPGGGAGTPVQASNTATQEIAYVPIVPIAMDMIEKSGLLQPLELNVLPPCQHCNKQPYPFLMIVSEGQEQTYSGSSIMGFASHGIPASSPATSPSQLVECSSNTRGGNGLAQETNNSPQPSPPSSTTPPHHQSSPGRDHPLSLLQSSCTSSTNSSNNIESSSTTHLTSSNNNRDAPHHLHHRHSLSPSNTASSTSSNGVSASAAYDRVLLQAEDHGPPPQSIIGSSSGNWNTHHLLQAGGIPTSSYGLGNTNSSQSNNTISSLSLLNSMGGNLSIDQGNSGLIQHLDPLTAVTMNACGFLHLRAAVGGPNNGQSVVVDPSSGHTNNGELLFQPGKVE